MKKYTEEHEWITLEEGVATVGISAHAAHELGDITFIELPEVDTNVKQGDSIGTIESVKAASDIYSPVGGRISAVNTDIEDSPEIVNDSPEEKGWLCKLDGVNEDEMQALMTDAEYEEFITGR
ncbi:MAG: glycine cleavage system protein GcvH [Lentisphaeria bacterium]|nr:glycine cleavage system protein GcvH [Lentisphaeria bacterium]MDP7743653.1 glycine cleavage system protein GcvH [Lentisphaeria bacterium]